MARNACLCGRWWESYSLLYLLNLGHLIQSLSYVYLSSCPQNDLFYMTFVHLHILQPSLQSSPVAVAVATLAALPCSVRWIRLDESDEFQCISYATAKHHGMPAACMLYLYTHINMIYMYEIYTNGFITSTIMIIQLSLSHSQRLIYFATKSLNAFLDKRRMFIKHISMWYSMLHWVSLRWHPH